MKNNMAMPKQGKSRDGRLMHYSAGAVIFQNDKYLLIERAIPPLGFAGPAGHVDEGETPEETVRRETKEEVGLTVENCQLLREEEVGWNRCVKGAEPHYWYLYQCAVSGEVNRSKRETKSVGWYTKEEMEKLELEPVWKYWFKKLGIL